MRQSEAEVTDLLLVCSKSHTLSLTRYSTICMINFVHQAHLHQAHKARQPSSLEMAGKYKKKKSQGRVQKVRHKNG